MSEEPTEAPLPRTANRPAGNRSHAQPSLPLVSATLVLAAILSPGLVYFLWTVDAHNFVRTNRAGDAMAASASRVQALFSLVTASIAVFLSRRQTTLAAKLSWLAPRLAILPAVAIVSYLHVAGIERARSMVTLTLVMGAALLFTIWASTVWKAPSRHPGWWQAGRSRFTDSLMVALIVVVGALLAHLALLQFRHGLMSTPDLAIYSNTLWNTVHGDVFRTSLQPGESHLSSHFDPLFLLIAPIYALFESSEVLLIAQAFFVCSTAWFVYLITATSLGSALTGIALGAAYLLHPAVHATCLFEFHSLALSAPAAAALLYFFLGGSRTKMLAALLILLLAREDLAFTGITFGIYVLVTTSRLKDGCLCVLVALSYLIIVKLFVMTDPALFVGSSDGALAKRFAEVSPYHGTFSELVRTSLVNPFFVTAHILGETRVRYILLMFAPLVFLPFFAPGALVLLSVGIVTTLFPSNSVHHYIYTHYTMHLVPIAAALAPLGIERGLKLLRPSSTSSALRSLSVMILATAVLCTWKYGALVPNRAFLVLAEKTADTLSAEERALRQESHRSARALLAEIPEDQSVFGTPTVLALASNRRDVVRELSPASPPQWMLLDHGPQSGRRRLNAAVAFIEANGYTLHRKNGAVELYARSAER